MFDFQALANDPVTTSAREVFDSHAESSIFFDVSKRTLYYPGDGAQFVALPHHVGLFRDDNGAPIGDPVGKDYGLVHTKAIVLDAENAMEANLPAGAFKGAEVHDKQSFFGAYTERTYLLPALGGDITQSTGKRTKLAFMLRLSNSYGGRSPVRFRYGNLDYFCTNGMMRGDIDMSTKRHTKNIEHYNFENVVKGAIDTFQADFKMIKKWANGHVTERNVSDALDSIKMPERTRERLKVMYHEEVRERGATIWAMVSAVTANATHGKFRETGNDHHAFTTTTRQIAAEDMIKDLVKTLTPVARFETVD